MMMMIFGLLGTKLGSCKPQLIYIYILYNNDNYYKTNIDIYFRRIPYCIHMHKFLY